jgi:hypothetical protein
MSDDRKLTQDEARRIVDDGIADDVKALKDGRQDMQAARSLLEEFRLSNPRDMPELLFSWLHDVFGRILDGEAPDEALGMKRGRGERRTSGKVDPLAIAMYVDLLARRGVERACAINKACEYFAREIDTILAALKDNEPDPDLSEDRMEEYIQDHRRPV